MKIKALLGAAVLGGSCTLLFLPTEAKFAEDFGANCFDGEDNDGVNGIDCADPSCELACKELKIEDLTSNSCFAVPHEDITGDDHGGIAISFDSVIVNGEFVAASFTADDLTATAFSGVFDGLFSDLSTGKVYTFVSAELIAISGENNIAAGYQELDPSTGATLGEATLLSQPITISGVGIFSGKQRVVVLVEGQALDIDIKSGAVAPLGGVEIFDQQPCENSSYWGVAELFQEKTSLVYASNSHKIIRKGVGDSTTPNEIVGGFYSLGDMCAFTVSPKLDRWYFHSEASTSFSPAFEQVGYCDAILSPNTKPASAVCGDGVFQGDEECDDGNDINDDGCTSCKRDVCGDGVKNQVLHGERLEACDDGNTLDGDGCSSNCVSDEVCGNGFIDFAVGEGCDDGNNEPGDGCEADCSFPCMDQFALKSALFDSVNNRCYAVFELFADWPTLRQNCIEQGGELTAINTQTELEFVLPLAHLFPWIGLNDLNIEGTFEWSNGEAVSFTNFLGGQPDNFGDIEHCIEMKDTGEWNDLDCSKGHKGICEIDCALNPTVCF